MSHKRTEPAEVSPEETSPSDEDRFDQLSYEEFLVLEQKASERNKYLEHLQLKQAELENYRRRVEREQSDFRRYAGQLILLDQLLLLDAMELAILSTRDDSTDVVGLRQGLEQLHQQLLKSLRTHGVQEIEALGRPFDPTYHEVMLTEETTEVPHMSITEVLQKGYQLHDRLLRATRVKVASQPQPAEPSENKEESSAAE